MRHRRFADRLDGAEKILDRARTGIGIGAGDQDVEIGLQFHGLAFADAARRQEGIDGRGIGGDNDVFLERRLARQEGCAFHLGLGDDRTRQRGHARPVGRRIENARRRVGKLAALQDGERTIEAGYGVAGLAFIGLQAAELTLDARLDGDQRIPADLGLQQIDLGDRLLEGGFAARLIAGGEQGDAGRPLALRFHQGRRQFAAIDDGDRGWRACDRRILVELADHRRVEQRLVLDVARLERHQGVLPLPPVDEVERFVGRQLADEVAAGLVATAAGEDVFRFGKVAGCGFRLADI